MTGCKTLRLGWPASRLGCRHQMRFTCRKVGRPDHSRSATLIQSVSCGIRNSEAEIVLSLFFSDICRAIADWTHPLGVATLVVLKCRILFPGNSLLQWITGYFADVVLNSTDMYLSWLSTLLKNIDNVSLGNANPVQFFSTPGSAFFFCCVLPRGQRS